MVLKIFTNLIWLIITCSWVLAQPSIDVKCAGDTRKLFDRVDPESAGLDPVGFQQAVSYLESHSFEDGIEELLIIKDDKIIHMGDSSFKQHNIYSCSKVFTSTVLGLLVQQDCVSLTDPVFPYEASLTKLYPKITFRHFATMTSGYRAVGRSRWNDENADWSHTPYIPDTPHFAPGTHFEYWDEAQMMFGKVLTTIIGIPMKDYLTAHITDPIGMGSWEWHTEGETETGIPINNGCTNVHVNAHQLARFGLLFLKKGNWFGKQLLSSEWCSIATSVQVSPSTPVFQGDRKAAEGSGSYGFNWWVNSPNGLSRMPDAPLGVYYMSGLNHNVCAIIPEWNMIVVRMGDDRNPLEQKHMVWNEFLRRLGNALN